MDLNFNGDVVLFRNINTLKDLFFFLTQVEEEGQGGGAWGEVGGGGRLLCEILQQKFVRIVHNVSFLGRQTTPVG